MLLAAKCSLDLCCLYTACFHECQWVVELVLACPLLHSLALFLVLSFNFLLPGTRVVLGSDFLCVRSDPSCSHIWSSWEVSPWSERNTQKIH